MLLPLRTREHVLTALGATPLILQKLVLQRPESDPVWDVVEPGRFTPREHVAHMAEWDSVFLERMRIALKEDLPLVPNPDETQLSIEGHYADSVPVERARAFADARAKLLAFLHGLPEDAWSRTARHPRHGIMSLEAQAVHVLGHDGYHLDFLARKL